MYKSSLETCVFCGHTSNFKSAALYNLSSVIMTALKKYLKQLLWKLLLDDSFVALTI